MQMNKLDLVVIFSNYLRTPGSLDFCVKSLDIEILKLIDTFKKTLHGPKQTKQTGSQPAQSLAPQICTSFLLCYKGLVTVFTSLWGEP